MPVVANAQAPACPDEPVAYEGTDAVVNELRALRHDQWQTCAALFDQGTSRAAFLESIDGTLTAQGSVLNEISQNTAPGDPQTVEVDQTPVVEAIDSAQLELDAALWFLAGLLAALVAGALFAREVLG
jgi:hypothetical protein